MLTGMLWFDNSSSTLADKVRKAAAYYKKKYSRDAEICLVNPSMIGNQKLEDVEGITVRPYRPVLPHHLWIGVEDLPEYAREQKAAKTDGVKPEPTRGPHVRSIKVNVSGEMISRFELNRRLSKHAIEPGTELHSPKYGKMIVQQLEHDQSLALFNESGEQL